MAKFTIVIQDIRDDSVQVDHMESNMLSGALDLLSGEYGDNVVVLAAFHGWHNDIVEEEL